MSGSTYTVSSNGYTFEVNSNTGTTTASGQITAQNAARNGYMQSKAGGELRGEHDQGGHLVAASENGPAIRENLFAQDKDVNLRGFKNLENAEKSLVKDSKTTIDTQRIAYVSTQRTENGMKPDAFMVNNTIHYSNGKTETTHHSMQNMSYEQQEAINQELENMPMEDYPNPGDTLRESMTPEEYADLMESTDQELGGLKDEYAVPEEENTVNSEEALTDSEAAVEGIGKGAEADVGEATDGGTDGGLDGGTDGGLDGGADGGPDGGDM